MRDPFDIIKKIRLTEKASMLTEKRNEYIFRVDNHATKQEIKYAIEKIFNKKVLRVNTLNVLGKKKRQSRPDMGKCPDWKKAIVTLKAGDKINLA